MNTKRIDSVYLSNLALTMIGAAVCLMLTGCFGATYSTESGPTPEVASPSETSSTTTTTTSDAVPTTVETRHTTSAILIP
jgi:hypothetical protein